MSLPIDPDRGRSIAVNWRDLPEEERLARFSTIYRRHEQQIYRHAYYMLGHREDADDVKQETFLRAYQALDRFRCEAAVLTWLLKICSNLCHNRLRTRMRQREVLFDPQTVQDHSDACNAIDPISKLDRSATVDAIWKVIRALPGAQSELIIMSLVEGRKHEEIAAILGCTALSAKLRVFRARRQFRERVTSLLEIEE